MVVKHMNCLCTQHIYRMGQDRTNKIQNDAKFMHTKLVSPSLYSFFKVKKDGGVGVLVLLCDA